MQAIDNIFGPAGPLARHLPGFTPCKAQMRMAGAVAAALEARRPLLVEAGTGTGKTFAYLVPALFAGLRVLVSTGTRTLQDQLYSKDVPLVAGAIGTPAKVALLKGRSNYLCTYRLKREAAQGALEGVAVRDPLMARIESWALVTRTGDLAEVAGFNENHALWPKVTSTRDNCLGTRCSEFADCHVVAARREAQAADLVIVNHHLLLADLALKEDGFGDLLGTADAVILDEAHQLPDLATQFFGVQVSSRQIDNALVEGRAALLRAGGSLADIGTAARAVEAAISAVLAAIASRADLESASLAVVSALRDYATTLSDASREPAVEQVATRAVELAAALERVALCTDDEGARTSESNGRSFTLGLLPFDISERFRGLVESRPAAWVFTSATLSVATSSKGEDFSHFASRLGLADAEALRIPSPFDYESQALLYLPAGMPEPTAPNYVDAVISACVPLLEASGGGAFILFTSHRALSQGAALLRARWDGAALVPILVQGEGPREKLLRDFREHGNAVLLGTASFWEGVDVKGEALRLVVIEKLPFASPDDPLTKARLAHLQRRGENAFRDYQLPEAVLALKQGVGRLIRSETDRGMIVIADPRLLSKGYGRTFRASLPEMPVTQDRDEALRFLRKLR
ncbi:MAG: ATP-dependent DNA helicase [Gammaproteobacteria bacterium]|nr:ATP-dependent DNA helicase [Gammaproteobacteria bacterium]